MKKLIALLTVAGLLMIGLSNVVVAQDADNAAATEEVTTNETAEVEEAVPAETTEEPAEEAEVEMVKDKTSFHQVLKEQFIAGGPAFMGIVLVVLILGLALVIERIIYLNLSTTNTKKLLASIEDNLSSGGLEAAKEVCRNTRGPVASIFYQGLDRADQGLDVVEKSVISYGSVAMGRLEKGLSWISLFIALAPMLGFMGTVIGMIGAFDSIVAAGDISATIVAGGIKVALLTTVFGLIVAIILQIFYNYIVSKVDSLVNDMEDSTITFMDILTSHTKK